MLTRDEIVDQLLAECDDDHVGLWELVNSVRFDLDIQDPGEIRAATLGLARALLEKPGIDIGFPAADGRHFIPWNLSREQAMSTIEEQWDRLGRCPDIGEIAWFTSRSTGQGRRSPKGSLHLPSGGAP
jgi:hypothetical protein